MRTISASKSLEEVHDSIDKSKQAGRLRRIENKADRTISISEAWRKGLIGGLPDNF